MTTLDLVVLVAQCLWAVDQAAAIAVMGGSASSVFFRIIQKMNDLKYLASTEQIYKSEVTVLRHPRSDKVFNYLNLKTGRCLWKKSANTFRRHTSKTEDYYLTRSWLAHNHFSNQVQGKGKKRKPRKSNFLLSESEVTVIASLLSLVITL